MTAQYPTVLAKRVLEQANLGVPIVVRVPKERPKKFIRVDASNPQLYETQVARECTLIIQAYAGNDQECLDLLDQAETYLDQALNVASTSVGWIQEYSPYRFEDPDRPDQCRWQFTGTFHQALH